MIELSCSEPGCDRKVTHKLLPGESKLLAIVNLIDVSGYGWDSGHQRAYCPKHKGPHEKACRR